MFVSKAGCNQRCQNLFFFSWLDHSLTLSLFLLLFIVFVVLWRGLDAVQIAVANRDSLSSPPLHS